MSSLMTTSLILFSCWGMIAKSRAGNTIMDFFATFNGDSNNFDAYNKGGLKDKYEGRFKPVIVQALQKEPMVYIEEAVNGNVYRMLVGNVTAISNGDIIYITSLNFTNPSHYTPGSFNTDDLAKLPREAFQGQPDCVAAFRNILPGVYSGEMPDCRHAVKKQHPEYSLTFTCDNIYFTSNVESIEDIERAPVVAKFKRPKYPVIGAPKGYVSPCKDKQ